MTRTRQILFIQGGGAGAHDEWDDKLVESLSRELGTEYEVRYPRMPDEGDPSYARWSGAIRREMADLDDGAVVAGHSVGAAILVNTLAEQPPERGLRAIVLIAAPFVGEGGWPSDEFGLTSDLGARLPPGVRVHVFHGLQDETTPPSHADLYALAIPQAQVRQLPSPTNGAAISTIAPSAFSGGCSTSALRGIVAPTEWPATTEPSSKAAISRRIAVLQRA